MPIFSTHNREISNKTYIRLWWQTTMILMMMKMMMMNRNEMAKYTNRKKNNHPLFVTFAVIRSFVLSNLKIDKSEEKAFSLTYIFFMFFFLFNIFLCEYHTSRRMMMIMMLMLMIAVCRLWFIEVEFKNVLWLGVYMPGRVDE